MTCREAKYASRRGDWVMSRRRVPRERGTPSHSKPGAMSRPEWRPSCNVSARQSARLLASGDIRRELVEGQCGPADGDGNPEPLNRMRTRGWDAVRGVDRGRGRAAAPRQAVISRSPRPMYLGSVCL